MDKLISGLSTTLIGMMIVFFGLLVLILCIQVMHRIMGQKEKPAVETREAPAVEAAPPAPEEEPEEEDDGELVAVITAAVMQMLEAENTGDGFVVRRIRRISNSPVSARLSRNEQMYSHL